VCLHREAQISEILLQKINKQFCLPLFQVKNNNNRKSYYLKKKIPREVKLHPKKYIFIFLPQCLFVLYFKHEQQ